MSSGLLGQRVHVNVDFDTERDYSSNNNVQIYYEGLQDEIVQRVDVGTVVFQPPAVPLHHRRRPGQQLRRQRHLRGGPGPAPDPRRHPEGQRRSPSGPTRSARPPVRPRTARLRDLDFESGRFFWVVDPDSLPGYPAIDILTVSPNALSPTYRPSQVRIYRYRAAASKSGVNPNLGGITAFANRPDSPQQFGPVRWELLIQGTDYYLDQSGLWIVLATKLDQNDYLAVSYRTAAGNLVGTFPEADRGTVTVGGVQQARDTLELIVQPQQGPALPTFRYEMRQVYRVAGADLDAASLQVGITLNRVRASAERDRADLPAAARASRSPATPTVFDRDQPALPARSRIPRRRRSSASPTSSSRTSSRSPIRPASRRPRRPTRCTERRCSCCSRRDRRPSSRSGCSTTPPAAATARRSTSTRCSSARTASSSSSAGGSWCGGWTTRSPTTWAR